MIKSFDELVIKATSRGKTKIALVAADDHESLEALARARNEGLAEPVLLGDRTRIEELFQQVGRDLDELEIYDIPNPVDAATKAVELVRSGKANVLMKGLMDTGKLLRAVLNKENGLRASSFLTHIIVFSVPQYHKLLVLSDAGMVIAPDLEQKIHIVKNAVTVANGLGIEVPKVAMLCAIEKVNYEHMPATMDAAIISKMAERRQLGSMIVDGPLSMDTAVNAEACQVKKLKTEVGGDADVLIMPNIESGNIMYKSITQFQPDHKAAGIVMGAKCPIVLLSRADSSDSKFYSIALANLLA